MLSKLQHTIPYNQYQRLTYSESTSLVTIMTGRKTPMKIVAQAMENESF